MTRPFERFERECMEKLGSGRVILDVGGGSRFMKRMKKYEPFFKNCEYKTLDISPDYHPDIVGDIHALPLSAYSVDGVICRSVLEHVERPSEAIREMYRVLKPGGKLFLQVPSIYPYHARGGFGSYPDYWRFFEDSLRLMLKEFSEVHIQKHGGWFSAMSFFFPGQERIRFLLDPLSEWLDRAFRTDQRTTTPQYSVCARK